jgi:Na+(H+)/acetate symporter ActP
MIKNILIGALKPRLDRNAPRLNVLFLLLVAFVMANHEQIQQVAKAFVPEEYRELVGLVGAFVMFAIVNLADRKDAKAEAGNG